MLVLSLCVVACWQSISLSLSSQRSPAEQYTPSVANVFFLLAALSLVLRIVWIVLLEHVARSFWTFAVNRLAFIFYIAATSLVIANWAEVIHKRYVTTASTSFLKLTLRWWLGANMAVVVAVMISIVVAIALDEAEDTNDNRLFQINLIVLSGIQLLLALVLACYAVLMFRCDQR